MTYEEQVLKDFEEARKRDPRTPEGRKVVADYMDKILKNPKEREAFYIRAGIFRREGDKLIFCLGEDADD